jgi:hypothetical protein
MEEASTSGDDGGRWIRVGDAPLRDKQRLHVCVEVRVCSCEWPRQPEGACVDRARINAAGAGAAALADARPATKQQNQQKGRYVTLLRVVKGGALSAIDSVCFHAGGPLVILCFFCVCLCSAPPSFD